jgi:hypothetical protein
VSIDSLCGADAVTVAVAASATVSDSETTRTGSVIVGGAGGASVTVEMTTVGSTNVAVAAGVARGATFVGGSGTDGVSGTLAAAAAGVARRN